MTESGSRVALVTGGNRGLGRETCRQLGERGFRVLLTARNPERGGRAAEELRGEDLDVDFHRLDVTEPEQVERVTSHVEEEIGRLDVLVNNAGVYLDREAAALEVDVDVVRRTMEVNAYGRVVNVSSGSGSFDEMGVGTLAYGASKTWLNAMTRKVALELRGSGVLVNAACPGVRLYGLS